MGSISARSAMTKYIMEPLVAAGVYFFRAMSISTSVFSLSSTLSLMMLDVVFESARVSMRTFRGAEGRGNTGNPNKGKGKDGVGMGYLASVRVLDVVFDVPSS